MREFLTKFFDLVSEFSDQYSGVGMQQSVIYISIGDKIFRFLYTMVVGLDLVMLECSCFL